MPKYVFTPLTEVVREDWKNNTEQEFPATDEQLQSMTLTVNASSEDEARIARMPISNILAWELVETIED